MLKKTSILTGFLGAGKTTYLNHLIKNKPSRRYAIIENEFGDQSIDGELIIRSDESIVEMNNGCLCCSLNDNLYDLLSDLHYRKDEFDELVIEATGVADPAGIAEPFLIHPAVKKTFQLKNVICLIDAELIEDQLRETEEARKQIAFSNVLLINKTDLVHPDYVLRLGEILSGINPTAVVLSSQKDHYPLRAIDGLSYRMKGTDCNVCPEVSEDHHELEKSPNGLKLSHSHTHTHQHSDITTHTFVFKELFNLETLYHLLFMFLTFQSNGVYRIKGILASAESNKKTVLQTVGKRLSMEEIGEWEEGERRESKIVFIGKDLKPEGLRRFLERSISKSSVG